MSDQAETETGFPELGGAVLAFSMFESISFVGPHQTRMFEAILRIEPRNFDEIARVGRCRFRGRNWIIGGARREVLGSLAVEWDPIALSRTWTLTLYPSPYEPVPETML